MVAPIIPILIALGVGAIAAGCSDKSPDVENDSGADTDVDGDTDVDADTDIDTDTDTDVDGDTDVDTDADTDTSTDTESDTETTPDTPFAPGASVYSDAPCAFPASITHQAAENRLYVTCGGTPGTLWKSPVLDTAGDWTDAGQFTGFASNHAMIDDTYAIVAHSVPSGFTILDYTSGTASQVVDFDALTIVDSSDDELAFSPNTPAGIALAGGKLYIATNNIDVPDYTDPALTTFHPGTVIHFDYNGDGTVDASSATAHMTSGLNPTGLALVDDSTLAILSSGSYDPLASEAAMEICTLPGLSCTAIDLGDVTGQASPVMPITDGGLILAGIQKPDNRIMGIDDSSYSIGLDRAMSDVDGFISNIVAYGDVAIMSDFGVFGSGGQILFAHTDPLGWTGVPITPVTWGSVGPAVIVGSTLYATSTSNDGMSGRIYEVNLSAMD